MPRTLTNCRISRRVAAFTVAAFTVGCAGEPEEVETVASEIVTTSITYRGWNRWTNTCASTQHATVYEPAVAGSYPVFVYAIGTGALVGTEEGELAAREMASRGFVAAVVSYDTLAGFDCAKLAAKASCTFAGVRPLSAVSTICRRGKADCRRGIVVAGLSQGASLALLGANADPRIRAAWLLGFGGGAEGTATSCYVDSATRLPADRVRVVNGRFGQLAPIANLNAATGSSCSGFARSCLRANGSGWFLVENADVEDGHADHCYFVGPDAGGNEIGCTRAIDGRFDAGWAPPADAPWSLAPNLDWLASFAD